MKLKVVCVGLFTLLFCSVLQSQEQVSESVTSPSSEHGLLRRDVGVWDAEITMWPQGPDAEPVRSNGVETVRMLGELWNISDIQYEMEGRSTSVHGMMGFDPRKEKYNGVWCDSGSPYPAHMKGTYDEASKTLHLTMKSRNSTGKLEHFKLTITYLDDVHKTLERSARAPDSEEYTKILRIDYSKR